MTRCVMLLRVAVSTALLCVVAPVALRAQVVRGTVVDGADHPVAGVVVALVDSTQAVVARALSDDRGEYRVAAPRAGTYRLRTLRIGYQPTVSAPRVFGAGTISVERLVVDGVRVMLDAVRVVERSTCGRQVSAEAGAVLSAWEQAMTSIAAATLTSAARGLTATTMQIERVLEPNGRRVRSQSAVVRTDYVTQPWRSIPADTLRERGYTQVDAANFTTYYAPGLDVLTSPRFLLDHCVQLVAAKDTSEIGIAFVPTEARRTLSEIRGTLWLARATADLRRVDFAFTDAPNGMGEFAAGGTMSFARVPSGAVVVSSWEIRMPQLVKSSERSTNIRVDAVAATGGQIVVLRQGADTLFRQPPLQVAGIVLDSVSGKPIGGATLALIGTTIRAESAADGAFTLSDVLPGEYLMSVRTPSLDSVRAATQMTVLATERMASLAVKVPTAMQLSRALCGVALSGSSGRDKGAVLGAVRDGRDTTLLGSVRVVADWTEFAVAGGVRQTSRRMETRTDSSGAFRLCGVPTEATLTLRAQPAQGRSAPITARLAPDQRFASVQLVVDRTRDAVATLTGTVVADSTNAPLPDAEITIPSLTLSTRSDARGEFRLAEIPAGTHDILVRRVGYGALVTPFTFAANEEESRRMVLRRSQTLDSVEVTATRLDRGMSDFEENRRVGLGHFLTRDDLAKNDGRKLGDVLVQVPGLGVVQGRGGRGFVLSKRYVLPLRYLTKTTPDPGDPIYWPSGVEQRMGIIKACYAQVYVDDKLMNPTQPTEPFDVNSIAPDQIEGVEYYAGPAQTPSRYAKLSSACGVLVIHTRRFESIKKQ